MIEFLTMSLILFGFWIFIYLLRSDLRREILFSSLICMPLGLSEPLFIPSYWSPNALLGFKVFNLSFDLESLIFCFAIGGIAAVTYEFVFEKHLKKARIRKIQTKRYLLLSTLVLIVSLILFSFIFREKFIYTGIVSMALAAVTVAMTRKDLAKEILYGSLIFTGLYFVVFVFINNILFPDWIARSYNFSNLIGLFILKIPIEEILWALSFGALWAPLYEEIKGLTVR